ncbi:alpha/beta fold hydrolase [Actinoplanes sp. NPDC048988]|uniref:alpha/beta fold hydrolase n=1 Tax=Actinoplanes sp. NPDC048988 TaxID=3363901 RepID=UPI0037140CCC
MPGFDGYELEQITVGDQTLRVRRGGSGPPLLLLHGYPETHLCWSAVAGELARDFTVVAPDLRGYGGSSKPVPDAEHHAYSKRAMASDVLGLMAELGYDRFDVAGHDRGGRVGYRLALDRPPAVRRLTVLDVVPTGEVWARADDRFALAYWHWAMLAQPYPVPEILIVHDPDWFFFDIQFGGALRERDEYTLAEYSNFVHDPGVVRAICEDYRAGATTDRAADDEDRANGRRIACPVQVLWSAGGPVGTWYDPLEVWRGWAGDVTGEGLAGGHFLPEENPAAVLEKLRRFHAAG